MFLRMNRKRKVIVISPDESYSDVDHNQIKHEFLPLKRARNDGHPINIYDQNIQGVEQTSAKSCTSNLLSPSPEVQSKLEEYWNHSYGGMRYFISDRHPTIVPDQNTEKIVKTNNNKKLLSLDDTLCQKLYTKINIDENFIEIVRNNNMNRQEQDIQGITNDRNNAHITVPQDSNLQKVFKAYPEVESCPRISHVDLLPLIEILSQNRYRKIFIDDNFIRIIRNRPGKQIMNGIQTKKDISHTVLPESMTRTSQISSSNLNHHFLYKDSFEKQANERHVEDQACVFLERKMLNVNPHLTTIEDQNINLVERARKGKLILPPNGTLSPKLYRKIFFTETFIGIVRKKQNKIKQNRYARNYKLPTISHVPNKWMTQHARYFDKNKSRKMLMGKRRVRNGCYKNQKHAFHDIDYARTESHSSVVQDTTQRESDELSSKDLLPLIKILSQNLYRKITIGKNFIAIHRNRHGDQRRSRFSGQKYARPFSIKEECQEYGRSFDVKKEPQEYARPFSIGEESLKYGRAFNMEEQCQEVARPFVMKEESQMYARTFSTKEECQEYGRTFSIEEESQEYARPFSIKEASQEYDRAFNIEEECQEVVRPFGMKEESQMYARPFSTEEESQEYGSAFDVKEESQEYGSAFDVKEESQEYVRSFSIEKEYQEYGRAFSIEEKSQEYANPFSIEKECQEYVRPFGIKEESQEYARSFCIEEESQEYVRPFSILEECQEYGRVFGIEKECQEVVRPFGMKEESQVYARTFSIEEEIQEYDRAFDIKEDSQQYARSFIIEEECQEYGRSFDIKVEFQEYARPFSIKKEYLDYVRPYSI